MRRAAPRRAAGPAGSRAKPQNRRTERSAEGAERIEVSQIAPARRSRSRMTTQAFSHDTTPIGGCLHRTRSGGR